MKNSSIREKKLSLLFLQNILVEDNNVNDWEYEFRYKYKETWSWLYTVNWNAKIIWLENHVFYFTMYNTGKKD